MTDLKYDFNYPKKIWKLDTGGTADHNGFGGVAYLREDTLAAETATVAVKGASLAQMFHDTYERLAPSFGYETRPDTKIFDPESPNGKLMTAVCASIRADLAPTDEKEAHRNVPAELNRTEGETPYDRGYVWGYRHGLRDGSAPTGNTALPKPSQENDTWTVCPDVLIARYLESVAAIALAVQRRIAAHPSSAPQPTPEVEALREALDTIANGRSSHPRRGKRDLSAVECRILARATLARGSVDGKGET